MEETVGGPVREKLREEAGGGGIERGVVARGIFGVLPRLRLEFGETEGDGRLDLLREVQIVAGDLREERVDEMQATQIVAVGRGHGRRALVTYPENPAQNAQDFRNPKSEVQNPKQVKNSNAKILRRSEGQF
jgi:hypothetical protein